MRRNLRLGSARLIGLLSACPAIEIIQPSAEQEQRQITQVAQFAFGVVLKPVPDFLW